MKVCLVMVWNKQPDGSFLPEVYGEYVERDGGVRAIACNPEVVTHDPLLANCQTCKEAQKAFTKKRLDAALEHVLRTEKKP